LIHEPVPITASMALKVTGAAAAAGLKGPGACTGMGPASAAGGRRRGAFLSPRGMAAKPAGEKSAPKPLRPRAVEAKPVPVIKPFREAVWARVRICRKETWPQRHRPSRSPTPRACCRIDPPANRRVSVRSRPRSTTGNPVARKTQAVRSRAPGSFSDYDRSIVDRWLTICMPEPSSPSLSATDCDPA